MFRLRGRPKDCVVSEETKGRARRRLAAVLVAGLRPLFPGDERGSFARLRFCLTEIIVPLVSQFDGSIFKQTGDLVRWGSPHAPGSISLLSLYGGHDCQCDPQPGCSASSSNCFDT